MRIWHDAVEAPIILTNAAGAAVLKAGRYVIRTGPTRTPIQYIRNVAAC
jgi:hypothetical protein